MIHLTNDAVQKKDRNYGKYESGNKLTFQELQQYIDAVFPGDRANIVQQHILPTMKYARLNCVASDRQPVLTVLPFVTETRTLAQYSIAATAEEFKESRHSPSFELFG